MTHEELKQLAEILKASKEPIDTDLQVGALKIKTDKNSFWILLSLIGIAFSVLLFLTHKRGPNNLLLGFVTLSMSLPNFWRMQNINKTLIINLTNNTFS